MHQRARPLTIGVDARFIQDKFHGIGRYTYHLLDRLAQLDGEHRVIAFVDPDQRSSRFSPQSLARAGQLTVVSAHIPLYHPTEWLAWNKLLRVYPVDVFHSPFFWSPLLLPCPLVTTIHDLIFDRYPKYMPQRQFALVYRLVSRLAVRRSRQVIAVSEATRKDIVTIMGIPETKVRVVYEGVDSSFRRVTNPQMLQAVRERYQLPSRYVLALGARRPHKNIGRLIEAFAQLSAEVPQSLVLVGAEDNRFAPVAQAALTGLKQAQRLNELDYVAEHDLPAIYSMADLFVQPSIIEGFGLPVLEAMSCGCPVACSNTSSLPEVAGDAALLFDPLDVGSIAQAIRRALLDVELRTDLAVRGRRRAAELSWERTATQTLSVYQAAAGYSAGIREHETLSW
jgi:alpha-1,3-rhamnosyl/mannosyltransferase